MLSTVIMCVIEINTQNSVVLLLLLLLLLLVVVVVVVVVVVLQLLLVLLVLFMAYRVQMKVLKYHNTGFVAPKRL